MIIKHSHDCGATTVFRKWLPSLVFRAVVWERAAGAQHSGVDSFRCRFSHLLEEQECSDSHGALGSDMLMRCLGTKQSTNVRRYCCHFLSREVSSDMDKMHPLVSVGSTCGNCLCPLQTAPLPDLSM